MDADLAAQLQSALEGRYRIVRELGGGGMSRVFLADDIALERSVVIKVLHPELAAGVNADRFNREVHLSARLQHPHIVPVLSAGDVNGLPFYVMPFVKGESLRARIDAGAIPVSETIGILGDVAKALSYAHSDGVVHRDIKPDNILLMGGAATVADFGIAKAISSARRETEGALTSVGTSLGTPAYMAPEQVAGDPDTDHRADIYSLGCVAYEMLTGKTPFAGKSPQQMLAAHVMEQPSLAELKRTAASPALVDLVARCLSKEPAKRLQNADDIVRALDDSGGSRATFGSPRRALAIGAAILVAAGIGAFALMRTRTSPSVANDGSLNLAVAPFEVLDPQLNLWREGIVDVLSRNLDGAGPVKALSPASTIRKWSGRAERESAIEFGKKVGAQIVMYGQLQSAGAGIVNARLWVIDAERGGAPVEVEVRDSVSRMDRVTDSLSVRSLAAIGRLRTIGAARLASLGSSSLPAIRAFLKGAQHFRRAEWDSAAASLKEATTNDSTFGIAYAMLGEAYGWMGSDGNAQLYLAYERAGQLVRPGLSPHDSLTLVALGHYARTRRFSAGRAEELRSAIAAATAVTERYPDDAPAQYLLADMRFHNDRTITEPEALAGFDRAIRADSDFAPAYIHAIELAYRNGTAFGRRYISAYLARPLSAGQRSAAQLAMRAADGDLRGAALNSIVDTARSTVLVDAITFIRRSTDSAEARVSIMREGRKRADFPHTREYMQMLPEALAYRGHVTEALEEAVANSSPIAGELIVAGAIAPDSAVKLFGGWLKRRDESSFVALYAFGEARDTNTLKSFQSAAEQSMKGDTNSVRRAAIRNFLDEANAYVMLARGDSAGATRMFSQVAESPFGSPNEQFLAGRLIARSDPRKGLAMLERMSNAMGFLHVARQLEVARIAEKLGDADKAVSGYALVAEAWRNTDSPMLRSAVTESIAGLKRLDADGKRRASLR